MFKHAKPKKLLSLLLSAGMIFSAMAATVTASAEGEPAPMSLLPLEEESFDVYLDGYTDEELATIPLSTILAGLTYRYEKYPNEETGTLGHSAGDPVTIGENDVIVMGETGGNYRFMDRSDTVDLTYPYGSSNDTYTRSLELIIGSGKQLDKENERFNITVHVTKKYRSVQSFTLYTLADGIRVDLSSTSSASSSYSYDYYYLYTDLTRSAFWSLSEKENLYLEAKGSLIDISTNSEVASQVDISYQYGQQTGNGYCLVRTAGDYVDFTYSVGGTIVYTKNCSISIDNIWFGTSHSLLSEPNGSAYELVDTSSQSIGDNYTSYSFRLKKGYSVNGEYYYRLKSLNVHRNGNLTPCSIVRVVKGSYASPEEADAAEDITETILGEGYKADYSKGVDFTILYKESETSETKAMVLNISTLEPYADSAPSVVNRPTVGSTVDPYFSIYSIYSYDPEKNDMDSIKSREIDGYDSYGIQDSYYGYGYHTWFLDSQINSFYVQKTVDPSSLKLNVNTDESFRVYNSTTSELVNFDEPQDFSGEKVQYTVSNGEETLNRFVSIVVKSENGPRLYVCGPEKREIYFDTYFGEYHDILIANPGNENLTGLKVEWTVAPQNVKIDDYWTVGGEKNDTLEPISFSSSYSYRYENNFAKIRLVPDGDGEVGGTLKISADGQAPYFIELSGHAGDPKIVTESPLVDAVKYVPYNAIIATDKIHDWQEITFTGAYGLPAGLSMNEKTGEIYGVPQEAGTYTFSVTARVSYPLSSGYEDWFYIDKEFELTVLDNTDLNVYEASDEGYTIVTPIGTEGTSGARDYRVKSDRLGATQLFVSSGTFGDFIDLWLNGEKLNRDEDYTVESGSTRITIRSQTFADLVKEESNTLAAEFRVDGDLSKDLKRTSQNFIITDLDVPETPSNPSAPSDPTNPSTPSNPTNPSTPSGSSTSSPSQNNNSQNGVKDPVQETIDLIKAIPSDPTADPGAVDAARKAYDALTDEQKNRVENYQDLLDAEAALEADADDEEEENNDTDNADDVEIDDEPDDAANDFGEDSDVDGENAPDGVAMYGVVIDLNGIALSGVEMELHSDVQRTVTSQNGSYRFETAEFGAHTLILTDPKTGASVEKKFTLVEADATAIEDDVIYAPNRANLSLSIAFDGKNILFLQANDPRLVQYDGNVPTGVPLFAGAAVGALIAAGAALAASPKRKKRK